jgi:alkylation response protein AidB-like acyl-CoA dehydrogenase
MDFRETDEQAMLRQMVRKFAQNEVKPVSVEFDKKPDPKECFPWDLLKKASKLGLRTASIPAEYGGGGVKDLISHIIVMEELGAGDNGFASCIRSVIGLASWMDVLCNKEQKNEFFPKIVNDDTFLIATAGTEPNSGTDNVLMADIPGAAMQTFAERKGDEYIINGTKHFISNGGIAKLYLVHARSDRKLPLNQCRSLFLVPSDTPGFSIGKFHNKLGRRLLMTAELIFDDMRVPARYLVRKEGEAGNFLKLAQPFVGFLISACTIGALRACYEAALDHARIRVQGGKPIVQHQLIAAELSEMRVRIEAARMLLYRQAWCWQNKYNYDPKLTILVRTFIDQIGGHIVFQMNDILGGSGSDKEMITEKYIRDLFTAFHGPSIGQGLIRGAPDWQPETKGVEIT